MIRQRNNLNKHQYYNHVHKHHHQLIFVINLQKQRLLNQLIISNLHQLFLQQKQHQFHLVNDQYQALQLFKKVLNQKKNQRQMKLFRNFIFLMDKIQLLQQMKHNLLNNYDRLKKNYLYQNRINYN